MPTITTPRLVIASTPLHVVTTRLERDDFAAEVPLVFRDGEDAYLEIWPVQFPPEWPGDAVALLPTWKERMEADEAFQMLGGTMIDRAGRVAVGQITLEPDPNDPGTVELGYGVNPPMWGRGYATEAARALVSWARKLPWLRRIISACAADNLPSIRVLEKAGFTRTGERNDEEGRSILWEYPG